MSNLVPVQSVNNNYLDPERFNHMLRVSNAFSQSDLVPQHFRGKVSNCFIALQMAFRLDIDPMMALQNMHIVHGNPGISSQLCIALANKSGVFKGPIWFQETGIGDTLAVRANATLASNGQEVSQVVTFAQAVKAGWTKQKDGGTKPFWAAMPGQMLKYRSAVYLIRSYAPEAILGMHTKEEWEDAGEDVQVKAQTSVQALMQEKAQEPANTETAEQLIKRGRGRPPRQPLSTPTINLQSARVDELLSNAASGTTEEAQEENTSSEKDFDIGF